MNNRQWLKDARVRRGLTQQDLAEQVGVTREFVSQLESGTRKPRLDTIHKLVGVLQIDPMRFLSEVK